MRKLPQHEITKLSSNIDQGVAFLRHLLEIAEGLKMALDERDRAMRSVKQGFRDWIGRSF